MLDIAEIRKLYFDPPPDDRTHLPTREELYARYERQRFERCVEAGMDPRQTGHGEFGSLIGGSGKPLTVYNAPPEMALRTWPLPLSWFDYPAAHRSLPARDGECEAIFFLASLSAGHLAGMPNRPSGDDLAKIFRSAAISNAEWAQLWDILGCIHIVDLKGLLFRAGLSIYEIARAIHLSEIRRGEVCMWINQFAIPPEEQAALTPADPDAREADMLHDSESGGCAG